MFTVDGADELESHWQTCGSETAGNGDCGNTREVRGTICAKQQGSRGMILVAEADGFLTDWWRHDRCAWDGYGVDACIFERQMVLLDELFAKLERGEVDRCGDSASHFEARANVIAVISSARRKPSGLLMIVSCFGPSDLIAGVFGFA
jgi:hypothetical protein